MIFVVLVVFVILDQPSYLGDARRFFFLCVCCFGLVMVVCCFGLLCGCLCCRLLLLYFSFCFRRLDFAVLCWVGCVFGFLWGVCGVDAWVFVFYVSRFFRWSLVFLSSGWFAGCGSFCVVGFFIARFYVVLVDDVVL